MTMALSRQPTPAPPVDESVFEKIAAELERCGFCELPDALPAALTEALHARVLALSAEAFHPATIGRDQDQTLNGEIRRDEIHWIDGDGEAERGWLAWTSALMAYLNRRLFLGLFSYESHFAHYPPGAFYKRHVDAFRGQANRILTTVFYLNPAWSPQDGGEMLLYPEDGSEPLLRLVPAAGTLALFLSEEFPHEVRPARRDRYSIAGWFRLNTSTGARVDPPR